MPDGALVWVDASGASTAIRNGSDIDIATGVAGRFGPPIAMVVEEIPLQPGQRIRNVRHGPTKVALPILFHPASAAAGRASLRAWAHRLDPTRGDGRLQATSPSGDTRELVCRYAGGLEELAEDFYSDFYGAAKAVWHFTTEQPYWQDVSDTVQSWSLLSSLATFFPLLPLRLSGSEVFADATVDNSVGDVEAWPVWIVTGPGSNPILRNLTTGKLLSLPVTLSGGESVTIDTRPGVKMVTKGDGTNLFGSLTSGSALWSLVQGSNSIRLEFTSATTASQIALNWRRRYLSA